MLSTIRASIRCPLCRADHPRVLPARPVDPRTLGIDAGEEARGNVARGLFSAVSRQIPAFRLRVRIAPPRYFVPSDLVCLRDAVVLLGEYEEEGSQASGGVRG